MAILILFQGLREENKGNWTKKKHYPMKKKEFWHISKTQKNLPIIYCHFLRCPTWSIKPSCCSTRASSISMNYSMDAKPSTQASLANSYRCLLTSQRFFMPNWERRRLVHMPTTLKELFASIYEPTILRICWATKSTYKNCTSYTFHHFNEFLASSSITFLNLKWLNNFFTNDDAIFSLISIRS